MKNNSKHHFENGRYTIDDYDRIPGFCSFLPGVAGPGGVPLWAFYVNRGQGMVSFGRENKDGAIAEFLPATWAYQLVYTQGFRTFLLLDGAYYEPFQRTPESDRSATRHMTIEPDRFSVCEMNCAHNLKIDVSYLSVVEESLPALIRRVKITNTGDRRVSLRGLDGLAVMVPAGITNPTLKEIRRLSESFAHVKMLDAHIPFFATQATTADSAEITEVREGHFYAGYQAREAGWEPMAPIVDPGCIFGPEADLLYPHAFLADPDISSERQVLQNRLPCAMTPFTCELPAGASMELVALIGHSPKAERVHLFLDRVASADSLQLQSKISRALIESITAPAFMVSNEPLLDAYAKMNYLDNVLRGGQPHMLPSRDGARPIRLYARRHGDLERDYNAYILKPHPLSDGAGNFRDVCQNQRFDTWFYPDIHTHALRASLNLLQADGYNPLGVEGYRWRLPEGVTPTELCPSTDPQAIEAFIQLTSTPFSPGALLGWANEYANACPDTSSWWTELLSQCPASMAAAGHEGGFWVDHWIYITDMLEAFEAVYPDRISDFLTGTADISWHDEGAFVQPRSKKYRMRPQGPMQLDAVTRKTPEEAAQSVALPPVTPLAKLIALLAVKAVSLDPEGRGIEMEAERPGWDDALNGLPALFGSSVNETAEAARLAEWLLKHETAFTDCAFPRVVASFVEQVLIRLSTPGYDWETEATLRESYRFDLSRNQSADRQTIAAATLQELLTRLRERMLRGVAGASDPKTEMLHTYYTHTPLDAQGLQDGSSTPAIGSALRITRFEARSLPLFLEGQVHAMRLLRGRPDRARTLYTAVRNSPLFDREISMYKLNDNLDPWPLSIGRVRSFCRGWFENESVWMHMEYKYLIELLRNGLYEEFFADAATMLTPFLDPDTYGRSVLENSSFIAPSCCPDTAARGRGFVARLTGTTVEFIHLWTLLTVGPAPFILDQGQLKLNLAPILPGHWFTETEQVLRWQDQTITLPANSLACSFLGQILLIYHNPARRDTFGHHAARPATVRFGDITCTPQEIGPESARAIRERTYPVIEVLLR